MDIALLTPFALHTVLVFFDEGYHRRRGLKRWESWGHPVDVASVLICLILVNFVPFSRSALVAYVVLASFSCLCITKDEFVHASLCVAGEHWIHAILFVLHPVMLIIVGLAWPNVHHQAGLLDHLTTRPWLWRWFLSGYLAITTVVLLYQIVYWNFLRTKDR
jgi:hypothetical protein